MFETSCLEKKLSELDNCYMQVFGITILLILATAIMLPFQLAFKSMGFEVQNVCWSEVEISGCR